MPNAETRRERTDTPERKRPREPREDRRSHPGRRARRRPSIDVGGPRGVERGRGIETGEETP